MAKHTSDINFSIGLDENKVPETIHWTAEDSGIEKAETKATIISVWDDKTQETLRIDLWTKDMPVDRMKKFVHQNLLALADTLERAANEKGEAEALRKYALKMGENLNVLRRG